MQFKAIGVFSDNSSQDLTDTVVWSSSNLAVLKISNEVRQRGKATRIAAGSATVTATFGTKTATTTVTTSSATISSIQITPVNPKLADGYQLRLAVTALLSDNTTADLTDHATYTTSDATRDHISNAADSKGLVTALATGTPSITAYFGSSSSSTGLTVTSATLSSIEVSPRTANCIQGKSIQFQATGLFSDQTSQNLTDFVVWKSSDILTANAVNAAIAKGRMDCYSTGSARITAATGTVSGSTGLTVLAAGLNQEAHDAP